MVISDHNFLITKFMLCQASHQFEGKCREGVHSIKLVPCVQIYLRRSFLWSWEIGDKYQTVIDKIIGDLGDLIIVLIGTNWLDL